LLTYSLIVDILKSQKQGLTAMRTIGILVALAAVISVSVPQLAYAQENAPMTLMTDNNSMRVSIDWNPREIEPDQGANIILEFLHPFADSELAHVNYNLEILDEDDNVIESMMGLHTHVGADLHTLNFDNIGNFKVVVTVIGTGINPPFDTSRSGTVEASVVVVPEFPIAPIVLAAATGLAVIGARLRARR
jgi:hypothetical protein